MTDGIEEFFNAVEILWIERRLSVADVVLGGLVEGQERYLVPNFHC